MPALQKFHVAFGQWTGQGNYMPDPHISKYITATLISPLMWEGQNVPLEEIFRHNSRNPRKYIT